MRSLWIPALSSWNWRDWTSECQEAISNNVTVWRWLIDGKLKPHTIDEFRFCRNQQLLSSWHYWCILGAVLPHQRCGKYVVHAKASVQGTPGTCMAGQRINWIGCSDLRVHLTWSTWGVCGKISVAGQDLRICDESSQGRGPQSNASKFGSLFCTHVLNVSWRLFWTTLCTPRSCNKFLYDVHWRQLFIAGLQHDSWIVLSWNIHQRLFLEHVSSNRVLELLSWAHFLNMLLGHLSWAPASQQPAAQQFLQWTWIQMFQILPSWLHSNLFISFTPRVAQIGSDSLSAVCMVVPKKGLVI